MINVLFIADKLSLGNSTIHGVTQLFAWWIPKFDQGKYNVSLCIIRGKDKAGDYLKERGISVTYLGKRKFNPLILTDLLKVVRDNQIDIIHLHGYGASTYGRLVSLITHTPSVLHEHMVDRKMPIYQRILDYCLAQTTTRAIAVSKAVRDFMSCSRFVSPKLIEIVPNGVPLDEFRQVSKQKRKIWLDSFSIPEENQIIGIVGRLHPIKGHHYFLEAASLVLKEYRKVSFLVVGDGDIRSHLEEYAKDLGISKSTFFVGFCGDIPLAISAMNFLVIASLSEGGPLTLFEAMAVGRPVISTDVIGLKDCIEVGKTGYLVPPKDPQALATKMLDLLLDPDLCKSMGKQAALSVNKYDNSFTVRSIEKCYDNILLNQ